MGKDKKQLISTAFDELNKDLPQEQAYFLQKIASNYWVSKIGIYTLHAVMLVGTVGFGKFITEDEILAITKQFSHVADKQRQKRDIVSGMENLSIERLKDMFDTLEGKGKLCYDYKEHLMYVKNFHDYVPFGNASPAVIIPELLSKLLNPKHHFYKEYLEENRGKIKNYLTERERKAEEEASKFSQSNQKKREDIRLNPNFIQLKSIIFN